MSDSLTEADADGDINTGWDDDNNSLDDGWGDDTNASNDNDGDDDIKDSDDWDDTQALSHTQSLPTTITDTELPSLTRQSSFRVLDNESLEAVQDKIIQSNAEVLFVSNTEAACLLRHYGWKARKLQTEWFENSAQVRKTVGLTPPDDDSVSASVNKPVDKAALVQCQSAYCDEVPFESGHALACGHFFCGDCWSGYLTSQINEGQKSIFTTCMGMKCNLEHAHKFGCACNEIVPESLFYRFVNDRKLLEKYKRWLLDSFVEGQRHIKWCPKPGCSYSVSYQSGGTKAVQCLCGHEWCFSCLEEAHTPAPCDLVKKWLLRDRSDDATAIWLAAKTKECPKCLVRIEKNKACNHMTCTKCGFNFCLTGDSKVTLASGFSVRIRDMAHLQSPAQSMAVYSYDAAAAGGSGFSVRPAVNWFDQGTKRCVTLMLQDGREITCTPDHKFMTTEGWVEAQHLGLAGETDEHRILCGVEGPLDDPAADSSDFTFVLPNCGRNLTLSRDRAAVLALAAILGSLCSDGTVRASDRRATLQFGHPIDSDQATAALETIGVQYTTSHQRMAADSEDDERDNVYAVELGLDFSRDLSMLTGKWLDGCTLPTFVDDTATPLCVVREFLAGYYGGGGGAPTTGNDGLTAIQFCRGSSMDEKAITDTQALLKWLQGILQGRFGIDVASVNYSVKASGLSVEHKLIHSCDSTLAFYEAIGFRFSCHKQTRLMVVASYARMLQKFGHVFNEQVVPLHQQMCNAYSKQYDLSLTVSATSMVGKFQEFAEEIGAAGFFPSVCLPGLSHRHTCAVPHSRAALPYISLNVVSRRDGGQQQVYDIAVADTHNFLANGVTVHNCWLCKGPWTSHGSQTGGYYVCTKYDSDAKEGKVSSEEKSIVESQKLLQKYTYYYKRFKGSIESIKFTSKLGEKIEKTMKDEDLNKYAFLIEAVNKLIAARRILQWTYSLAYYLKNGPKKHLFEYQQEMLVQATESLQDIMDNLLGDNNDLDKLLALRKDIINKISSIDKFKLEMVAQVERGEFDELLLSDADVAMDAAWTCVNCRVDNKKQASHCIGCFACQLHGELECKACKQAAEQQRHR